MGFKYTVFLEVEGKKDEEVVAKQTFDDYDKAHEFAEIWSGNGLVYTIVEWFE